MKKLRNTALLTLLSVFVISSSAWACSGCGCSVDKHAEGTTTTAAEASAEAEAAAPESAPDQPADTE